MIKFYTFQTRWADMDPNGHLRHTAYNDYAAQVRINFLDEFDLPIHKLLQMGIGPILFREDTRFFKEIRLNESITINCRLMAMKKDGVRWHFFHEFFKKDDELAATILVEGAWLDLAKRKLGTLPKDMVESMKEKMPRTEDFHWL